MHLACKIRLTYNVWFHSGTNGHTSYQTFLVHLGDVCKIVVTTVTVPEGECERKSRDPVGRLRKWFSGTREESTVVWSNWSTKQ